MKDVSLRNVDKLKLAWHFDLEPGFTPSTPVEADGKVFITTGHSHIRALDAASGKLIWEYDARTRELAMSALQTSWGNKGLGYWNGRVIIATTDGRVIGLDANSGKPVWEQRQFSLDDPKNGNGAPRVFGGKVIIGHGGADITAARGYLDHFAATGEMRLRKIISNYGLRVLHGRPPSFGRFLRMDISPAPLRIEARRLIAARCVAIASRNGVALAPGRFQSAAHRIRFRLGPRNGS